MLYCLGSRYSKELDFVQRRPNLVIAFDLPLVNTPSSPGKYDEGAQYAPYLLGVLGRCCARSICDLAVV